MTDTYDFGGYATKIGIKCADGRTIMHGAFAKDNGTTVPLVWHHMHDDPQNVLGHAVLEERPDGMYAYAKFNKTPAAQHARELVQHGDIKSLSIYANNLQEKSKQVLHGRIREVSLVLSGANPGAFIDALDIMHSEDDDSEIIDEAIITFGDPLHISHAEEAEKPKEPEKTEHENIQHKEEPDMAKETEETVADVFATLTDKQKLVVYAMIAEVQNMNESGMEQSDEEGEIFHMSNVFDKTDSTSGAIALKGTLSHEDFLKIVDYAKRSGGSLRMAADRYISEHALAHAGTYGIDNIDYLFPDAQMIDKEPSFISRDQAWVANVLASTKHLPFSRIKSVHADITADEARAKGYVTGAEKTEEVFGLLKRETTPTTVYKKQKLDRDDIISIRDFDVVTWMKKEMRVLLNEELARAILVSDGRAAISADKISETNIRPIWTDAVLYAHRVQIEFGTTTDDIIDQILLARHNYKGSGVPTLYAHVDFINAMLLLRDTTGRRLYSNISELATELRVKEIVEVPVMAGLVYTDTGLTQDFDLLAIMVNLDDYAIGTDKGGEVNTFDDFDIDFNQMKYLIETRMSGALRTPKGALIIEIQSESYV